MSYKKIPNFKQLGKNYYWKASGWYRNFTEKTSIALGQDETKAIEKCLQINKQVLSNQTEYIFLSHEYALEYCKTNFIWWRLKSEDRQKTFMNWFNYLGDKVLKDKKFKDYKITELQSDDVEKFYLQLTNVNYKKNTGHNLTSYKEAFDVYKELYDQCLRVNLFVESGLKLNPFKFKRIRSGKKKQHATEQQLNLVIAECKNQDELLLGLAFLVTFYWNVREIDIIKRLKWSMYKPYYKVMLPFNKNHQEVLQEQVLINKNIILYPEIETYIDDLPSNLKLGVYMIQQKGTRKGLRRPYTYKTFNTKCRNILKDVGLDKLGITFESFRHGGITNLAESGATIHEIKASTKHKNVRSLEPYVHETNTLQISGQLKRISKKQTENE